MNEAQARSTGHDCIYDSAVDEWFTTADYAARVQSAQAILPKPSGVEPALVKTAPVSEQADEPAKPIEAAKPATKSNDAPTAPKKEGK